MRQREQRRDKEKEREKARERERERQPSRSIMVTKEYCSFSLTLSHSVACSFPLSHPPRDTFVCFSSPFFFSRTHTCSLSLSSCFYLTLFLPFSLRLSLSLCLSLSRSLSLALSVALSFALFFALSYLLSRFIGSLAPTLSLPLAPPLAFCSFVSLARSLSQRETGQDEQRNRDGTEVFEKERQIVFDHPFSLCERDFIQFFSQICFNFSRRIL